MAACDRGFYDLANLLVMQSNAELDTVDYLTGTTALHMAVERRSTRIVSMLLKEGANPNVFNRKGRTPLMMALANR